MKRTRVQEIQAQIEALHAELDAIQEACPHPEAAQDKNHRCNDNYSGKPEYMTEIDCTLCGKYWVEEGSV